MLNHSFFFSERSAHRYPVRKDGCCPGREVFSKGSVLLLGLSLLVLSACARKLPDSGYDRGGLVAIPTRAVMEAPFGSFVYYYAFSGDTPAPFEFRIYPRVGQDFSFSKLYPPGEYVVDTLVLYGSPSMNITPEFFHQKYNLSQEFTVTVATGTVTMLDILFEVTVRGEDQETFITTHEWNRLGDTERGLWQGKLQGLGNSEYWRIVVD